MRTKKRSAFIIALAVLAPVLLLLSGVLPISILPAFEGMNAGVEGVTINNRFYRIDQPLPAGYFWLSSDPHNAVLEKDLTPSPNARVRIEVGNPVATSDLLSQGKQIDYWVKDGDQYVHVRGEVVTYTLRVTLSTAITGTQWPEFFSGEKIWIGLTSVTWDRALQEQSPISGRPSQLGQAWEAPIAVYITSYNIRDPGEHGRVSPAYSGRFITLYSSPEQTGTISDLLNSNLNQTFAGDLRPDSRMQRSAYFAILLEDFGITTPMSGWFGSQAPVVDYEMKIYALRIGKFTYTNPDDTPWAKREAESYDPLKWAKVLWSGVIGWFSQPVNLFGMFLVLGITLLVIVIAFLFLTGLIIPLRAWIRRRNKK
ncbi:MAG: hypothetical protein QXF74_05135 [Nitrososphaerota archaeon]